MKTPVTLVLVAFMAIACQREASMDQLLTTKHSPPIQSSSQNPESLIEGVKDAQIITVSAGFQVGIQVGYCFAGGAWARVHDPNDPDMDKFSAAHYSVKWHQNGKVIRRGIFLSSCACGDNIIVQVTDLRSGAYKFASFLPPPCIKDTGTSKGYQDEDMH